MQKMTGVVWGSQLTCGFCLVDGKKEEIFCTHLTETIMNFILHLEEKHPTEYKTIFEGIEKIRKKTKRGINMKCKN